MNSDHQELIDLIHACLDGRASEEQASRLNARLRADEAARDLYLQLVDAHSCLAVDERLWVDNIADSSPTNFRVRLARQPWLEWRPLAAAAAGIVLGMFCTSMVFAYAKPFSTPVTRVALPVFDAGFESASAALEKGFPSAPGRWGADAAARVTQVTAVQPKQGGAMLKLEPTERFYSRLVQVIDVDSLRAAVAGSTREIELTASFHGSDAARVSRYKLRMFGFDEAAKDLRPFPLETEDEGVISATRVLDVAGGDHGWNPVTARMPLPPTVRSVVIWLGAAVRDAGAQKAAHFVDDVRVTLLVGPTAASATTP